MLEHYKDSSTLRKYICEECKSWMECYMLKREVWLQVFNSDKGRICPKCFEIKLGRPLTIDDFSDAYCNKNIFFAYNMNRSKP